MENNQRGGVLAFSLVAVVLFIALVGGVYAVKNHGEQLAGGARDVASEVATETDETVDQDEVEDSEEPATAPDSDGQITEVDESEPDQIARNDQDDDYDEVVEAPDDDTHSQAPSGIGSTGPGQVASTGPSEIAATGLADGVLNLIPVAILTTSVIAYARSRVTF